MNRAITSTNIETDEKFPVDNLKLQMASTWKFYEPVRDC